MVILAYRALSSRVLVVASVNQPVGDWAAYVDAVPGMNHDDEIFEVGRTGSKLRKDLAELLFPEIATNYQWRP